MKKVALIFIGGYLPGKKYGGPVTSIKNFTDYFCDRYDVRIICVDHEMGETERYPGVSYGWNKVDNALVYYADEHKFSKKYFKNIVKEFTEDIQFVYLSGIYYYPINFPAISFAKDHGIRVILAPRGDIMDNSIAMNGVLSKCKKLLFLKTVKTIKKFQYCNIQATSEEEKQGAIKYLGIKEEHIYLVPNLPIKPVMNIAHFKEKGRIKLLFISRIMVKKNLAFALEIINSISDDILVEFDIYGPIEEQAYWEKCSQLIRKIKSPRKKIEYFGNLDVEVAKTIYQSYDGFLFPTLSENYGHVIVEALLNRCLVFLSRGTTPWDDLDGKCVFLGDLNRIDEFKYNIEYVASLNNNQYKEHVQRAQIDLDNKLNLNDTYNDYITMLEG